MRILARNPTGFAANNLNGSEVLAALRAQNPAGLGRNSESAARFQGHEAYQINVEALGRAFRHPEQFGDIVPQIR